MQKGVLLLDGGIQGLFIYLPFKSAVLLILAGCWWFLLLLKTANETMDSSYVLGLRGFQMRPGNADLRDGGSASHLRLHRRLWGDEQPGPDQWLEIGPFLA